jgi:phenylacetate-coenzyme A ligase PaaK-like adenylate-forming protein
MTIVEGRSDDFLTTTDGSIISPLVLYQLWYLGHPQGVTQFRVIQETREKLTIQLKGLPAPLDQLTLKDARTKLREILGEDLHVEFQLVNHLDRDPSGKLRKVISRVTHKHSSSSDSP